MSVKIVVDSTANLLEEDRQRVEIVPMTVHFGKTEYVDGVTISAEEFYRKLVSSRELPHTSQATPYVFSEVFEKAVNAGNEVVAVILSSKLSGTFQSAVIAAADYPGKVFVVDSMHIALSTGLLVHYALELADRGAGAAEIAEELMDVRHKVHLMAVVDTLEYLQRGGRVSKAVAVAGGLLSIKPVIGVVDGEIKMLGKARGNKQANAAMNRMAAEQRIDFSKPCMLGYSGTSDALLQKYVQESAEFFGGRTFPQSLVCAVVGTHAGPDAVALAFFEA